MVITSWRDVHISYYLLWNAESNKEEFGENLNRAKDLAKYAEKVFNLAQLADSSEQADVALDVLKKGLVEYSMVHRSLP